MNTTVVVYWLLVAIATGSGSSPNTLAVLADDQACKRAAEDLYEQSNRKRGSPTILAYCIRVPVSSIVKDAKQK